MLYLVHQRAPGTLLTWGQHFILQCSSLGTLWHVEPDSRGVQVTLIWSKYKPRDKLMAHLLQCRTEDAHRFCLALVVHGYACQNSYIQSEYHLGFVQYLLQDFFLEILLHFNWEIWYMCVVIENIRHVIEIGNLKDVTPLITGKTVHCTGHQDPSASISLRYKNKLKTVMKAFSYLHLSQVKRKRVEGIVGLGYLGPTRRIYQEYPLFIFWSF